MFLRTRTAVVAALFLIGSLGGALAADPTPVEVFEKYRKDHDPRVRLQAVKQLAGLRGGDVVRALLRALEDEDERVRSRAAKLLLSDRDQAEEVEVLTDVGLRRREPVRLLAVRALSSGGKGAGKALVGALGDRSAEVRREAVLALGQVGDVDAVRPLYEVLDDRDARTRAAACEVLGLLRGEEALGSAAAVLRGDRAPQPKIAAVEVLGAHPEVASIDHLRRAVGDKSWSVRVAVARALGAFWTDAELARPAVAVLVPALEKEPRIRVRRALAAALLDLTGIDFGPDPKRWNEWWGESGATFEPPQRKPRRGSGRGKRSRKSSTSGQLLDLPLESDHVVFVLDASHSMIDPVRLGSDTTKQDALARAFERAVNRLPVGARMNLVLFGTEPTPWKRTLVSATKGARRNVVRFLEKSRPGGRTNLYDAIETALSDDDADTLVVVTDGAPSAGKRTGRRSILAGVAQLNRYRLARVHTVEVGADNTGARWRGFMRQLAESTGGHYLER